MKEDYQHWQLTTDASNILWLMLDKKNASTNTLDESVLGELEKILDSVAAQTHLRGLAIGSNKSSGFIAGAAIEQFVEFDSVAKAASFIRRGQLLFDKLAAVSIPTVAMIQGFCLGGGLELALACRYRVAEDSPQTRLGLPEVLLGIHPGWGGTVRLPELIGAATAMDLILTGRTVDARTAAKIGLVDVAVPKRQLRRAVLHYLLESPTPHHASFLQQLLNYPVVRPLLGEWLRKKVSERVRKDHYPAPYAVIDNWVRYGTRVPRALEEEANSLAKLQSHASAKNLIRVFFLQDRLKSLGKQIDFNPKHVHVVGAGVMGGDIAAWCALRGMDVTLQDREPKFIAPAIKRAYQLFKKKLKTPRAIQAAMDRLLPDPDGHGIPKADVIIEAIFENLEAKQTLFKQLEQKAKPSALLATNTSSITLGEIGKALSHPERLVGIHFFNPVAKMQLVEIVSSEKTDPNVQKSALLFARKLDRLPLPVKSSPGFLVNRVLMPYLMESFILLQEGVPGPVIDQAALNFGMPMGPIELADTVGLDICLSVAENLARHYGGTVPERLRTLVSEKKLGRKTGEGLYHYENGKPKKAASDASSTELEAIAERLVAKLLHEANACLQEQVVADGDLLDAGIIFGTGFAPFRGGPIYYQDQVKSR
jgi:3-hydroxyacyl-CoA dehydrogenase/enoyl-CoA hydratase/3-hydroxybutyryl-CoA epimerase